MDRIKFQILFTVFIDILGFAIIIPTLPYYVESFGATPLQLTLLMAVFSFFSFFSAPILGAMSDKFGRRPILIASLASTAFGWVVFSMANTLWMLFLGRIIDGIAAGNIPIAQSYLVDIAKDEKERTENLGMIGAIVGIGFIVGPAIGGLLSGIGPNIPFWFVAILSLINTVLCCFYLPEVHTKRDLHQGKISLNPLKPIVKAIKSKKLRAGYGIWLLFAIPLCIYHSIFALYLNSAFGYTAVGSGLFLTFVGLIIAFNQVVLMKNFWLKFDAKKLEIFIFPIFALSFFFMSLEQVIIFYLAVIACTTTQVILRALIPSQLVGKDDNHRGEIMGTLASIESIAMIVGPIIAGYAFEWNIASPFWIAGIIALFLVTVSFYNFKKLKAIPTAQ
ncbi:MFS transporter [bacterium]|nr:MFS transporter [bacterium]